MKPTLGVLITYYNERELLSRCLDSLLAQSERPDEIFIYDDASDAPAEKYVPPGSPITLIRADKNRGPSYGRNALLRISRSEYIHFHDADDLFHPDWCHRVRQQVEETGADVVVTEVSSYTGNDVICERVMGLDRLQAGEDLVRFCIQGAILTSAGTYRRTSVLAIGGYREDLWQSEDFDFHIRLAAHGVSYSAITDPLVIRVRSAGRSENRLEVWVSAVQAIARLATELPSQYRADLSETAARVGSNLFGLGAHSEARRAFRLARDLGPPTFAHRKKAYRLLAKTINPETAERVGACYRRLVPENLRRSIARMSAQSRNNA